jgi:hypothetical protein
LPETFEEGREATHQDQGVPQTSLFKELLSDGSRRFLPELPHTEETVSRVLCKLGPRLNPAIRGLRAIGPNAQKEQAITMIPEKVDGLSDVSHEDRFLKDEVIRWKNGHRGRRIAGANVE